MEVKRLLDMRVLGDLVMFKMEMNGPTVLHDTKASWRSSKSTGGGCLYDFASHAIDLVGYLLGRPDRVGYAVQVQIVAGAGSLSDNLPVKLVCEFAVDSVSAMAPLIAKMEEARSSNAVPKPLELK